MCTDTPPAQQQPAIGLLVNFPISDAIRAAPADAEQAARVLLLAAELMRKHEPLPYQLEEYLANAFEAALQKPLDNRVRELAFELNLTSKNKRPSKFGWLEAHRIMLANEGKSRKEIIDSIKKAGKVSRSHALRILDKAEKAEKIHQQICTLELEG